MAGAYLEQKCILKNSNVDGPASLVGPQGEIKNKRCNNFNDLRLSQCCCWYMYLAASYYGWCKFEKLNLRPHFLELRTTYFGVFIKNSSTRREYM